MNYIGSKLSLIDFLVTTIEDVLKENSESKKWRELIFADLFAGTGVVGFTFKKKGCTIISNDIQYYSYCLNKTLIENNSELRFYNLEFIYPQLCNLETEKRIEFIFAELEKTSIENGFIYNNYCMGGTKGKVFEREYFKDSNGKRCDGIRDKIEFWKENNLISENEYFYLLASLIESIDSVANTASVYGAFLKKLKKSAQKEFTLKKLEIVDNNKVNEVYNEDINELIKKIKGDILYLDPPYNNRQYASNYHILETIALNDFPKITGKTGLRDYFYQKSKYCLKKDVKFVFEDLIKNANFKYIFLSYNCEGIMTHQEIKNIMSKYGKYSLRKISYKRFKSNKKINSNINITEYLHCLIKK